MPECECPCDCLCFCEANRPDRGCQALCPQAKIEALEVCPHEDCPYRRAQGKKDCGNHEEWMT